MFGSGRDRFRMDGVGIEIVEEKNVIVTTGGWADEASSLIRVGFSCDVVTGDEDVMFFVTRECGSCTRLVCWVREWC